jgi:pimeloyl-ACP methyl ester carboxylesterase
MGAKVPALLYALVQPLRFAALRRTPLAFGWLSKKRPDPEVEKDWIRPFFSDVRVRRDVIGLLATIDAKYTLQAAEDLRSFDKPALIAWATEDKVFPRAHAEELARRIPDSRLEWIEDARTFVPVDQPERVAQLIRDFVREPAATPA